MLLTPAQFPRRMIANTDVQSVFSPAGLRATTAALTILLGLRGPSPEALLTNCLHCIRHPSWTTWAS